MESPKHARFQGMLKKQGMPAVSALTQRKPGDGWGGRQCSGVHEALPLGPVRGGFESQVRHLLVQWPPLSPCLPTVMTMFPYS